ncbi:hypothetical protein EVAR_15750_1 [Eumeta japonica]|uniref:Uncharacterized protein n=1 Tax=Eumeta variegata TaxID=151549 RepID=A0A4C1ZA25_EUMVA|nr:hypothetical protein EVAR_15750_1 [Eumeta japonica]
MAAVVAPAPAAPMADSALVSVIAGAGRGASEGKLKYENEVGNLQNTFLQASLERVEDCQQWRRYTTRGRRRHQARGRRRSPTSPTPTAATDCQRPSFYNAMTQYSHNPGLNT